MAEVFTGKGSNLVFPGEILTPNNFSDSIAPIAGAFKKTFYTQAQAGKPRHTITLDERKEWMLFNWLLRPPLTDQEIVCMPNMEVVKLYYSLNVVTSCSEWQPNAVNSRGLPHAYAVNHDSYHTQGRIYKLRPDLHGIKDAVGKWFPILLPVIEMRGPACDETTTAIQALSVFASILTFGAAWYVTLVLTIATETASVVNQIQQGNLISNITGRFREVLSGIQLAKAILPNPQPTPAILAALSQQRDHWQLLCATAAQHKTEVLALWRWIPIPELMVAAFYEPGFDGSLSAQIMQENPWMRASIRSEQAGHHAVGPSLFLFFKKKIEAYIEDWEPWQKFFFSDTVAGMVDSYERGGSLPLPSAQVLTGHP